MEVELNARRGRSDEVNLVLSTLNGEVTTAIALKARLNVEANEGIDIPCSTQGGISTEEERFAFFTTREVDTR